ncbi:MAG: 23S rRNA (adenine(2503)-C(2))-methyltransferase RlmN [Candidatus Krumholzibacteria bacterium]|nr:23S rRNA (adenine(2503)-C(2))-methyltransferase RlmN [Candidatus Krumholzibacteria bacterium]
MERTNIKTLSRAALAAEMARLGEPRHRVDQVIQWIWGKGAGSFEEMTNLPLAIRHRLDESFLIPRLEISGSVSSPADGSQKYLFLCRDGAAVESVLMEARGRYTVCISSQVGCALGCAFCRTGTGGFERDLGVDEILDQVLFFKSALVPPRVRYNVVFMGMGEPFLNMTALTGALAILNDPRAFALREKRITVSTIGMPDRIRELAVGPLRFGLAVSLNAVTDEVRRLLMPAAFGIEETLAAAEFFAGERRVRSTLEYVLIDRVNDSVEDARELARMTRGRPFKINLIPLNEWRGSPLRRPPEERIERFIAALLPTAPAVTVRRSQGADIDAACGQLRARSRSTGS